MTPKQPLAACLLAALALAAPSRAGSLGTPYTDPAQFTKIPFGQHSHWAQPWRAYLETVPATTFLHGTGINWNANDQNPNLVAHMLASHGIHHARIEIGWGNLDFNDETKINGADQLRARLQACKKHGIRPLILLNSHQGVPCPVQMFSRKLAQAAHKGDTTVTLADASGLKIGYSGLSQLTDYWAAEALITKMDGATVTLSKSLPKDIPAGADVPMATLKYRPFAAPGSDDYNATMDGWKRYVGTLTRFVAGALGTTDAPDKGFDMEIWNELTFGSQFLSVNNYYADKPVKYDENSIWGNLVKETAAYADAHPDEFRGVLFGDGFANTIPWPSSSTEPARIAAIDKHPYAGRRNYPKDNYQGDTLDALYEKDPYVPTYTAMFPEYFATALQTETMIREMAPLVNDLFGTKRGRLGRVVNGQVVPCSTWITEVNIGPVEDDPAVTAPRALALKAKTTARYFCFFLNKGVTQMDLFAASGGDKDLGLVQDNFLDLAKKPDAVYPSDDAAYTSPALAVTGRIAALMTPGLDATLTRTRPLTITSLSDTHDHVQFHGDGTPAHPDLYDRDVFAFLPFQVNARRFVIPYYVMTRDAAKDLAPEDFTVVIGGLHAPGAMVTAYDPIKNVPIPVTVVKRAQDALTLKLRAADYPYLLTVQEAGTALP